jgi:outer membrane protein assembly factor BamB
MRVVRRCVCTLFTVLSPAVIVPASAFADDWPQWLGPHRDGVWRETGIVEKFQEGGPRVRWRAPVAGGYAGPAVAGGRVFVTDWVPSGDGKPAPDATGRRVRAGRERVHCLREADGSLLWTHEYDCPYGIDYAAGPRTTPVVDGDRAYTLGAEGHLLCLDATSGKPRWSARVAGGEAAPVPEWGMATHPLIDGERLITLTGRKDGVVAAFDKRTGKPLWSALSGRSPGYAPPMIYEAAGARQLIVFHPQSVNSLDPGSGKVYWSVPIVPVENDVSIVTPRLFREERHGDLLLVSDAWNGSVVLKLGRKSDGGTPTAQVLWQRGGGRGARGKDVLHLLMAAPVVRGGHVYGVHVQGQFRCLNALNGNPVWETFKAANVTDVPVFWSTAFIVPHEPAGADSDAPDPEAAVRAFIANEHGELILARLSPRGYEEVSRARLLAATNLDAGRPVVWSHPAFANRSVYWRNDKEVVCASLAAGNIP